MRPRTRWAAKGRPARLKVVTAQSAGAGGSFQSKASGHGTERKSPPPADRQAAAVREAVAAERARIARDLHDSVDRTLHGIALAASSLAVSPAAQGELADPEAVRRGIRELASLARYAISETRCVIYELRDDTSSAALGDLIRNLATAWSDRSGVPVSLAVPPRADAGSESRREITAIVREALRNVEVHAHATRVRVSLRTAAERILLTIADNGRGFSLPADQEGLQATTHYGLISMTERARKLGGTLIIRSRPGHGTRIAVQVPATTVEMAR